MKSDIRHIAFLLAAMLQLLSCNKLPEGPVVAPAAQEQVTGRVHYRAKAGEGPMTRASVNDLGQYIFGQEDQLYITYKEGETLKLYGVLSLVAGAGATEATFEGDLICLGGFSPEGTTPLSATLVCPGDIHAVSGGKITGTSYPSDRYAATFVEAVSQYSDFTAAGSYGAHSFSLEQQSAFLLFDITLEASGGIEAGAPISAVLSNNNGAETLISATITPVEKDLAVHASFVAAFPGGQELSGAKITMGSYSSEIENATLLTNKYYNITRTTADLSLFTIQAIEAGTTVTFNYTGNGIQYKKKGGSDWTSYDAVSGITLENAGDYVQFRGKRVEYKTTDNTPKQIFSADKLCYIYGDIMSLICDESYNPKNTVNASAFLNAFRNATWIDIPAGRPLRLSATTLGNNCYQKMFMGCTSLTNPPELPARTVKAGAYQDMFNGCKALKVAPVLPADTVEGSAYLAMFYGCTSLTSAPAVLNGTSASQACQSMFEGCTSLANAPALPAMTVGTRGYQKMFKNCTALVHAPALPATTVAQQSYQEMFMGCSALTSAPVIAASALGESSCHSMFKNCTSLVDVPEELPAAEGTETCYQSMFEGCVSLGQAPQLRLQNLAQASCYQMFDGCTSLVTSPDLSDLITLTGNDNCKYMFRNCSELTEIPSVLNPVTLTYGCYEGMFQKCVKITQAPEMPEGLTLAQRSCFEMYEGCKRLATPPSKLTAETISEKAFQGMFKNCSALSAAPDLSAMREVGLDGCKEMFMGCTVLTTPPVLPATTFTGGWCYFSMFEGSGITTAPELKVTELTQSCYQRMMANCKYLEGPVLLPAATLVQECYREMFTGASRLSSVICLATDHTASNCTFNWLNGVSATGRFIKAKTVTDWATNSASAIPTGWTASDFTLDPIFPGDGPFDPEKDL